MKVVPYLSFEGNAKEAFETYARILDGKVAEAHTYGSMPGEDMGIPPGWEDKLMHVRLEAGDLVLMASDSPPGMKPEGVRAGNVEISLHLNDASRGEGIFNALAQGGTVIMPYDKTFWAERFGAVVDRFGIPWMINVG